MMNGGQGGMMFGGQGGQNGMPFQQKMEPCVDPAQMMQNNDILNSFNITSVSGQILEADLNE